MKRRLVSGVISGQDVCIFCAFRPNNNVLARSTRAQRKARAYNSSAIRGVPAGAEATQQHVRDNDDDEPPMLKRNAALINSFPFKKPSVPPASQQPISIPEPPQRPRNRPDQRRNRGGKWTQNGESSLRINYVQVGGRSDSHQPQGDQESGTNVSKFEPFSVRDTYDNRVQRTSQSPEERRRPSDRKTFNQRTQTEDQWFGGGTRRLALGRNAQSKDDRVNPDVTASGFNRNDRFSAQQRQTTPNFQRTESSTTNRFTNSNSRRSSGTLLNSAQHDEGVSSESAGDSESGPGADVDAPAGTSFDAQEEADSFHHRRGGREDRRRSRSTRLEFEDEAGDTQPATNTGQRSRFGTRGGTFDYAMAEAEEALYGGDKSRRKKNKKQREVLVETARPSVKLTEFMSVAQLAQALNVQLDPFIRRLEEEGFEGARYDNILDAQTSAMLADLYGFEAVLAEEESSIDLVARPPPEDISLLPPRPPIVTIMGHVDHGKTTILDFLRKSSVVATEHGGITQHIGAFSVVMPGSNRQITFLDTPGHAAFLEMRRRGANVTDIVVLVVAADDSVKPQTVEAIKHAIEAKVQLIVAINKVDKDDANIERVKQDLTRHDIVVEDYGGDYQAIPVSGKTGQGMAELEEAILTLADVYDFRAEQDGLAEGTIIESKVTLAGRVATVLVRRGTLRPGDFIVAGTTWARVRTLRNDAGALVTEAPPGTPVQVDGWRGEDPTAGLEVLQAEDEQRAKDVIDYRMEQRDSMRASVDMVAINEARNEEAEARAKVLAWEAEQDWAKKGYGARPKDNAGWVEPEVGGGPKQVHFVVKADVAGSVEAVVAAVTAVGNNEIMANVIHSGTGPITESDIRMLAASGETGYAISFNQGLDGTVMRLAEAAGLQVLDHNIIYKVTDVVKEKLAEQLPPIITQKVQGEAEVGQIFEVTIKKNKVRIAGCKVTNGTVSRANKVRVQRNGKVVYTGTLHSLKNVKKDVTEMRKGTECGMGFDDWDEFQEGDQVQCFEETEEKRTLY